MEGFAMGDFLISPDPTSPDPDRWRITVPVASHVRFTVQAGTRAEANAKGLEEMERRDLDLLPGWAVGVGQDAIDYQARMDREEEKKKDPAVAALRAVCLDTWYLTDHLLAKMVAAVDEARRQKS